MADPGTSADRRLSRQPLYFYVWPMPYSCPYALQTFSAFTCQSRQRPPYLQVMKEGAAYQIGMTDQTSTLLLCITTRGNTRDYYYNNKLRHLVLGHCFLSPYIIILARETLMLIHTTESCVAANRQHFDVAVGNVE